MFSSQPVKPLWSPPPLVAGMVISAPDFIAAASCLITWLNPTAFGQRMVAHLVLVMLLEFIVVHSAGFIGLVIVGEMPALKKIGALVGLGLLYSVFTGGFSLAEHTWWPFTTFWILIANRIMSVVISPAEDITAFPVVIVTWAIGAVLYLLGAVVSSSIPLPRFGITPEIVALQDFHSAGLWVEEPWRPLAFGVFYFTMFGIAELIMATRMADRGRSRPGSSYG
ncbi:MAG: hypothetical protein ABJC74_01045 [Gemmatimonadota bacterium]